MGRCVRKIAPIQGTLLRLGTLLLEILTNLHHTWREHALAMYLCTLSHCYPDLSKSRLLQLTSSLPGDLIAQNGQHSICAMVLSVVGSMGRQFRNLHG